MINNSTKRLVHIANRQKPEKYRILTFPTHERYESQLCKTGHDFYSFHLPDLKKWNKEQCQVPSNYYILPESQACEYLNYDFILVQSKFWQFQVAQQINQFVHLPIICLEHTIPTPQTLSEEHVNMMRNMVGDINIFISEYSRKTWGINYNTNVIHHGLDTNTFKPLNINKEPHVLTVANDFKNRDYCLNYSGWSRITKDLKTRLIGENSEDYGPAKSIENLVEEYNKCYVYFNSSTLSPIPMSLLEAMSCGCAVVSTATCMIPDIIKNGINGYISNDENELRSYIDILLNDENKRLEIGNNARQTILEMFSEEKFIKNWQEVFDITYEVSRI